MAVIGPFFPNVFVSTTRNGVPVFYNRKAEWHNNKVDEDSGMVELMPGSSSALAPLIHGKIIDLPGADYQRGDVLTFRTYAGGLGGPVSNPWHVMRCLDKAPPISVRKVALARLDFLYQPMLWKYAITDQTPGAVVNPSFNTLLGYTEAPTNGIYGQGWQSTIGPTTYVDWGPTQSVSVGVNEYSTDWIPAIEGSQIAEQPVFVYEDPYSFKKWDLLVSGAGTANERRFLCSDVTHKMQRLGLILGTLMRVEYHTPQESPWLYRIAL